MTVNMQVGKAAALILCVFCSSASARDLGQDEALRLRQRGAILPLEQLLQQVLLRHPGAKLLEAELEEKHDVYVYEVELLTPAGIVREIKLDASDGRLLKDEEDD
ncbi:PepSY domain-containing protein [Pseudomonas helleri]|uniref:Peptidase n=1 Tax=Pseudomonas helleri TaxID=1608996 RepID=A0A6A7Z5F3_9PSED|nr:PepSY domain-containing protein [Pseudomonas helleri]MQT27889.1 peptidase [Pseudomonas helleri]MQT82539.1 peptidase [Pseudomonas helleri]MQU19062.1 peptidase [Pseudomonas helleri]MQU28989.1 peptidase [Pseudomonas helleri]